MVESVYKWASIKPKLYAVIGGKRFDNIGAFSCVFELDNIPSATLSLPTGREMHTGQLVEVHRSIGLLQQDVEVEVFVAIEPHGSSPGLRLTKWPAEPFKIFKGQIAGISWERTGRSSYIVVSLVHWLSALNESSALSATSQPGNPASYTFAASASRENGESGVTATTWLPVSATSIDTVAVLQDLWGEVLLKLLQELSTTDTLDITGAGNEIRVNVESQQRIQKALARFAPASASTDYVPLALDVSGLNSQIVAGSIAHSINNELLSSWVNTTIWGKLVGEWGPKFGLSVCPRVDDCLVIPQVGALNGAAYVAITGQDYDSAKTVSASPQQIQAVGIVGSAVSDAGGTPAEQGDPVDLPAILGIFPANPAVRDSGILILKGTPNWLSDPVEKEEFSRATVGVGEAGMVGIPNAADPNGQVQPLVPPAEKVRTLTSSGIISRWAQHLYINEKLRGCVVELVGRFRVDLAPGSTVSIELPGDRFDETDQLGRTVFATIARVQHVIDGQNNRIATSFLLSHVRKAEEHNDPNEKYAASKPPLYKTAWRGASFTTTKIAEGV